MTYRRLTLRASLPQAAALVLLAGCDDTVSIVGRRVRDATVPDDTADVITSQDGSDGSAPDATTDRPPVGDVPPGMDVPPGTDVADVPDALDAPPGNVPRVIVNCGTVCQRPLDAVPDSMGRNVYFTAFTAADVPAVFRVAVPAPGAMPVVPTLLIAGMGMELPLGIAISPDDGTLYIADPGANRGTAEADLGAGAIFAIAAAGGTPRVLALGATLVHPNAVSISSDGNDLLVSAQRLDTTTGDRVHGVFRAPRAGSAASVVAMNLSGPSGVSQAAGGAVVTLDLRRTGPRAGAAVTIAPGAPATVLGDLVANYPAGVAHALDGRGILISGAVQGALGLLTVINVAGAVSAPASLSAGMVAPAGLHRARTVDVWSVADENAGDNGQIFLVTGPL